MGIYTLLDECGFIDASTVGSFEEMMNVTLNVRGADITICAFVVQPPGRAAIYFRCRQNHARPLYIEAAEATLVIPERGSMLLAFGHHESIREPLRLAGFERHVDDFG